MKYMPKVLQNNCKKYICNFLKVFKYFSEIFADFLSLLPLPHLYVTLFLSLCLYLSLQQNWGGGGSIFGAEMLKIVSSSMETLSMYSGPTFSRPHFPTFYH